MYPKVKVRKQIEEADQYDYERSSLQSLKAFEWLSLDQLCSADDSPRSPIRVPGSFVPKSRTPRFQPSEDETSENERTVMGEKCKSVRAVSAPRPRAVLSSPDNDQINEYSTRTRRELLSALKSHNLCHRHKQCKVLRRSICSETIPIKKGTTRNRLCAKAIVEQNVE